MTKKEMASAVASVLRERGVRKPVSIPKHKFTIIAPDGDRADFTVKQSDMEVIYTVNDVSIIIDAICDTIVDALKSGDNISIYDFGTLRLHRRAARKVKQPGTETWYDVEERLVPKFIYGKRLSMAARSYELIMNDLDKEKEIDSDFDIDEIGDE